MLFFSPGVHRNVASAFNKLGWLLLADHILQPRLLTIQ